jgi:hypothetical protein
LGSGAQRGYWLPRPLQRSAIVRRAAAPAHRGPTGHSAETRS